MRLCGFTQNNPSTHHRVLSVNLLQLSAVGHLVCVLSSAQLPLFPAAEIRYLALNPLRGFHDAEFLPKSSQRNANRRRNFGVSVGDDLDSGSNMDITEKQPD